MSRMSQLHAELTEQAAELGFESIDDALANGYVIDYVAGTLVSALEEAHEDWERERDIIVGDLTNLLIHRAFDHDIIERAIKFVRSCHD